MRLRQPCADRRLAKLNVGADRARHRPRNKTAHVSSDAVAKHAGRSDPDAVGHAPFDSGETGRSGGPARTAATPAIVDDGRPCRLRHDQLDAGSGKRGRDRA